MPFGRFGWSHDAAKMLGPKPTTTAGERSSGRVSRVLILLDWLVEQPARVQERTLKVYCIKGTMRGLVKLTDVSRPRYTIEERLVSSAICS